MIKTIISKLTPRLIRRIYYGRKKAKMHINFDNTSFYIKKMEAAWKDKYGYFHTLRCKLLASHIKQGRCLDIGTGNGQILKNINNQLPLDIIASDISKFSLINTSQEYPDYSFLCFDIYFGCIKDSSFDSVIMGEVLEHLYNTEEMLLQVHNWLVLGAVMILLTIFLGLLRLTLPGWVKAHFQQN